MARKRVTKKKQKFATAVIIIIKYYVWISVW